MAWTALGRNGGAGATTLEQAGMAGLRRRGGLGRPGLAGIEVVGQGEAGPRGRGESWIARQRAARRPAVGQTRQDWKDRRSWDRHAMGRRGPTRSAGHDLAGLGWPDWVRLVRVVLGPGGVAGLAPLGWRGSTRCCLVAPGIAGTTRTGWRVGAWLGEHGKAGRATQGEAAPGKDGHGVAGPVSRGEARSASQGTADRDPAGATRIGAPRGAGSARVAWQARPRGDCLRQVGPSRQARLRVARRGGRGGTRRGRQGSARVAGQRMARRGSETS